MTLFQRLKEIVHYCTFANPSIAGNYAKYTFPLGISISTEEISQFFFTPHKGHTLGKARGGHADIRGDIGTEALENMPSLRSVFGQIIQQIVYEPF